MPKQQIKYGSKIWNKSLLHTTHTKYFLSLILSSQSVGLWPKYFNETSCGILFQLRRQLKKGYFNSWALSWFIEWLLGTSTNRQYQVYNTFDTSKLCGLTFVVVLASWLILTLLSVICQDLNYQLLYYIIISFSYILFLFLFYQFPPETESILLFLAVLNCSLKGPANVSSL